MEPIFLNGARSGVGLATAKLLASQDQEVWGTRGLWFFDEAAGWKLRWPLPRARLRE